MNVTVMAVLAGVFFGIWPLLMNRSGLSGNTGAALFTGLVLVGLVPFAVYSNGMAIPTANWGFLVSAGILGTFGMLFFNGMLASASLAQVPGLFICTTLVQVVIPALYSVVLSGGLPLDKAVGFGAAALAAYLLLR